MNVEERLQYDTNVDDLDPRLWPRVIERLLAAGADDAWVTPILMKKGRPAFTLSALCDRNRADDVRATIFAETSTIGLRESVVRRYALDREETTVEGGGRTIGVKVASVDGGEVNRSVEWDDVVAAADALGMSAKQVLAAATAAAQADATVSTS